VLGDGTHEAELNWHLAGGTTVETSGDGSWLATGEGFQLQLSLVADATTETEIIEGRGADANETVPPAATGDDDSLPAAPATPGLCRPQGWVSPLFGVREAAPVISSKQRSPLPIAWATILLPQQAANASSSTGSQRESGLCGQSTVVDGWITAEGVVVTLIHPGWREIYAHSFTAAEESSSQSRGRRRHRRADSADDEPGNRPASQAGETNSTAVDGSQPDRTTTAPEHWLDLGEGRFRGRVAHLILDGIGRVVECSVVAGVALEWGGRSVWRAAGYPGSGWVPEDAHVVLPTETAESGDITVEEAAGGPNAGAPEASPLGEPHAPRLLAADTERS
jgi:hypothetical protein